MNPAKKHGLKGTKALVQFIDRQGSQNYAGTSSEICVRATKHKKASLIESKKLLSPLPRIFRLAKYLRKIISVISLALKYRVGT